MPDFKKLISRWQIWITLALVVKTILFFLLIGELGSFSLDNFSGLEGGDTDSYLEPIETYILTGNYTPDYRMPGYGIVYYALRLVFEKTSALNVLIVLQFLLSALSVYFLAISARMVFKSDRLFYLVYFTYLFSTYTSIFDIYLLTESFAVSATIFGLYFFIRGLNEKKNGYLLLTGLFFSWLIFLRPVYAPYIPEGLFLIILFYSRKKFNFKNVLIQIGFFLLPFIVIDGIWMIRNYSKYNKVLPLTKSLYYPGGENSYRSDLLDFLQSWGGSYIFWDPMAEIRWFGIRAEPYEAKPLLEDREISIPDNIYTSKFNKDSLVKIRDMISEFHRPGISEFDKNEINRTLKNKLNEYTASIKDEHRVLFFFSSRLIYFKKFLLHGGTYNLFKNSWAELSITQKLVKIIYSMEYLFIIIAGLIGAFFLIGKIPDTFNLLFPFVVFYSIIIFPFILRLPEIRYFVPAFPCILVCAMHATDLSLSWLNSKRKIKTVQ